MALKPVLYYSIRKQWGNYDIVAVTTAKTGRGGWHGRTVDDNVGTHGSYRDLIGRFDSQATAAAKIGLVKQVKDRYRPQYGELDRQRRSLSQAEAIEIAAILDTKPENV